MKSIHKIVGLCSAFVLVALGVGASFWSLEKVNNATQAREKIHVVIDLANGLLSDLKDAETGQRGFVLTGDELFLAPYLAVYRDIPDRLETLSQQTQYAEARRHLDVVAPLAKEKLAELSTVIALHRQQNASAALKLIGSGQGKALMDAIRIEMASFIESENIYLARQESELLSSLQRLFMTIISVSLLTIFIALAFVYRFICESRQRFRNLAHVETQSLLKIQEKSNQQLQQINATLQASEEKFAVTLSSIGDAVISTDASARVTLLNPVAEILTGWTLPDQILRWALADYQGMDLRIFF